MSQKHTTKALR